MPPKKRSFNGCWTCRSRKVKCDLQKPKCLRCEKSGISCGGYNIKLGWSAPLGVGKDGSYLTISDGGETEDFFQRRNIEFVRYPKHMIYKTFDAIDEDLDQLTELALANSPNGCVARGPFRLLQWGYKDSRVVLEEDSARKKGVTFELPLNSRKRSHEEESNGIRKRSLLEQTGNLTHLVKSTLGSPNLPYDRSSDEEEVEEFSDTLISSGKNNTWIHPELFASAKFTMVAAKGFGMKYDEQEMLYILYPKVFQSLSGSIFKADLKVLDKLYIQIPCPTEQRLTRSSSSSTKLQSLLLGPAFQTLIREFKTNMKLLMVVKFKNNFWEASLFPLILKIVGEMLAVDFMEENRDDAELPRILNNCIMSQVLCLSSYICTKSSSFTLSEKDFYTHLTVELRNISLESIHKCSGIEGNFDELLLALILQIKIDSIFGIVENFTNLFGLANSVIIKHRPKIRRPVLIDLISLMKIFFDATKSVDLTNYKIDENDENEKYEDIKDNYNLLTKSVDEYDKNYHNKKIQIQPTHSTERSNDPARDLKDKPPPSFTISFNTDMDENGEESDDGMEPLESLMSANNMKKPFKVINIPFETEDTILNGLSPTNLAYGLPSSLVDLFDRIITLTNHRNIFIRKKLFPRNFPKICADLEDELLNWKMDWKLWEFQFDTITNKPQKRFLSRFHEGLYHNINSFYYGVMIYFCRLIKDTSPRLLQDHVVATFNHISNLRRLNVNIQPLFWQYFVSGCDATSQDLQKDYQHGFEFYSKINSYWRAKQVMFEVWRRRDSGEEDICWIDVIREWEWDLFLG